jgi:thioredoxin 1
VKLLRFHATWCGPCKRFEPVVNAFAEKHGIEIQHVDIEEEPEYAAEYDIQSVPTTVLLIDGEARHYITGAKPTPVLEKELAEFI